MLQAPRPRPYRTAFLSPARGTELPISDGNTPSFISHHGRGNFLFPFCALLCIVTYIQHRYFYAYTTLSPYPPYNPPFPSLPQQKEAGLSPCLSLCHFELSLHPRPQVAPRMGFCVICSSRPLSLSIFTTLQQLEHFPSTHRPYTTGATSAAGRFKMNRFSASTEMVLSPTMRLSRRSISRSIASRSMHSAIVHRLHIAPALRRAVKI